MYLAILIQISPEGELFTCSTPCTKTSKAKVSKAFKEKGLEIDFTELYATTEILIVQARELGPEVLDHWTWENWEQWK